MEDKKTKIKTMLPPKCHEKSAEMKIRATEPRIVQAQATTGEGVVHIKDDMTHSQMLGKFEYTRGPIFKVVLEC